MTLSELIEQTRDKTGHTYRELADRAVQDGYKITGSTLHRLATTQLKAMPELPTLHALSAALRQPISAVATAALASLGIQPSPDVIDQTRARAWLTLTEGLSDAQVSHLLAVARTVADVYGPAADEPAEDTGTDPRGDHGNGAEVGG